jgi:lipoprotein-releasing system permease protein
MLGTTLLLALGVVLLLTVVFLATGRRIVLQLMIKYLFKRRLAWVSILAVLACVTMVLVVYSVMGGWLKTFKNSLKVLSGDLVIIQPGMKGFDNYEQMLDRIRALPEVKGAIPLIRTAGIADLNGNFSEYVMVVGLPSDPVTGEIQLDGAFDFASTLWIQNPKPKTEVFAPPRDAPSFRLWEPLEKYQAMLPRVRDADKKPGLIVGSAFVMIDVDPRTGRPNWNERLFVGKDRPVPEFWVRLTVLPTGTAIGSAASIPAQTNLYWIVDGSHSQLPILDKSVYVPFEFLQRELDMRGGKQSVQTVIDKDAPGGKREIVTTSTARTTEIHIALKDPATAELVKPKVQKIIDEVQGIIVGLNSIQCMTWQERQAQQIGAIEREIGLITVLFSIISLVAVLMVLVIFYTIVNEKTRDIGILKSAGTSSFSVALIFLGYGATIGVVGGLLGVGLSYLIVTNINLIHTKLGDWFGITIFTAQTYAFDSIPDQLDWTAALFTAVIATWATIVGALIPATIAALKKPVNALRFE